MSDELKPCPFCGSTNLNTEDARDFVACGDCYTEGPCNPGMGSAANIEAWNRRAAAQPPAAMAVPPSAWIDDVMEQAQVFASAWSLVGGRFDFGRGLTDAEEAKAELRAMLSAAPTPQAQSAPATGAQPWQPIETAPRDGRKIIVAYVNRNSKVRTVMARWMTDEQAAETDSDGVGLEGGWYECIDNWDDYTEVAIHEGEPEHWMPLPTAPTGSAG